MTAEHETTAPEHTFSATEAGTLLKNKREQLGLSQKQIADRLRLRVSIIESIENNQFSSDLVATFTKGYLRSYAKAVGIKESVILAAYEHSNDEPVEEQTMQSFSRQTKREKHDSRIMIITWGIVLVIVGISSVWWWQNQDSDIIDLTQVTEQELEIEQQIENAQNSELATELPAEITVDAIEEPLPEQAPVLEAPEALVEEALDAVTEPNEVSEPVAESKPADTPTEADEPTSPSVAENLLVMTFNGDCWIQVKDKSGKTISTGVKKAGQTLELSAEMPYKLVLGAPENVSMTLASEPVDLSGYTSGKVARFTLP
ncbi:hypothetical protein VISI1226_15286 [Vibrio sinaloensis DSM 21326]|uniref:HTH cro/C1-type domain-containing protein n=1 Tax=Vibrio sinaloensis DSM 21326 TaxID=945550 RepID=E8MCU0_PHOS4|nr:cytoskeleton protein RodZ [Vibrio sinaloensis]EGA68116.1 hypothetical protein VISI1226_15286 [Vibrio sinaloensis DSM 21326]